MAHEIEINDSVFSIEGTEWHGLAQHVETIDKETVAQGVFFPIIESPVSVQLEGENYVFTDHKILMADLRGRENPSHKILPLHTPKVGYSPIENERVFDMVQNALDKVGFKISTVGTLGDCKRFFMSVELDNVSEMTVNGEKFQSFLNFVTSHDGTLSLQAYDSNIRIVCQNTLNASQWHKGDLRLHVKHTKNASDSISNMEKTLSMIVTGREKFIVDMSFLASLDADYFQAQNFVAGYFAQATNARGELSTRSKNAVEEIVNLYRNGKGNSGKTFYDVLNGATEYFTHGSGTGQNASQRQKVVAGLFGSASNHKQAIATALVDDKERNKLITLGQSLAIA